MAKGRGKGSSKTEGQKLYGENKLLRVLEKLGVERAAFIKAYAAEGDTRDRKLRPESKAAIKRFLADHDFPALKKALGKTDATVNKMVVKYLAEEEK